METEADRTANVDRKKLQSQVDRNYDVFKKNLKRHMRSHRNSYALMRDGVVVKFCKTYESAWNTGNKKFEDGLFSIQKVTDTPMDMGYFSLA